MSQSFVESMLSRILNRDRFTIGSASIDLGSGSVTVEDLHLSTGVEDDNQATVNVDSITVEVDTNPLGEVGSVQGVQLNGVKVEIDLTDGELPDFSALLEAGDPEGDSGGESVPPIILRDSAIALKLSPDADPIQFSDVQLEFLPEEVGSANMILSGTMTAPHGLTVKVSGSGNFEIPEFRALVEIADIPLNPSIAGPYSEAVVGYLERSGIEGNAKKLSLWVEYPSRLEGEIRAELAAGVNLEFADISCTLPEMPYPMVGAKALIATNTREQGTVNFLIENESINGNLKAQGKLTRCFSGAPKVEVRAEARHLLVDPNLEQALRSQKISNLVWDALQPESGRVHADVRLWNDEPGAELQSAFDLEMQGMAGAYHGFELSDGTRVGFPLPLREVQGKVRLRDKTIIIDGLHGLAHDGSFQADGKVRLPTAESPIEVALVVEAKDFSFAPEIRKNLGILLPAAVPIYDEYSPRGKSDVRMEIETGPEPGDSTKVGVDLHLHRASASYAGFPLRFEQIRGDVDIDPLGVAFDLQGNRGSSELSLHGRFARSQPGDQSTDFPEAQLWLECKNLPLDSDLQSALANLNDDCREIWDYLDPSGNVDCEMTLWRPAGSEEFTYDVRIDLNSSRAQPEELHKPIVDLQGPIIIHGTRDDHRIDLSAIRGEIQNGPGADPARILLQGTIHSTADNQEVNLNAVVRDIQLTGQGFAEFLDRVGGMSTETWEILEPDGFVDIVGEVDWSENPAKLHSRMRVQLKNVASGASFLPGPVRELNGELRITDGVATFEDLRGRIGPSEVEFSAGSIFREEKKSLVNFRVHSEDFQVDHKLSNLMSGPFRETFLARNMFGSVKIDSLFLQLTFPDDGPFETEINGNLIVRDLSMDLGTRLENLTGSWVIKEARIGEEGGSVRGSMESGAVTVLGHRFGGLTGKYVADEESMVFSELQGRIHNGRLFGNDPVDRDLAFDFRGAGSLSCNIKWEQVSLAHLLRAVNMETQGFRGNLSGEFILDEMPGNRFLDATGRGEMRITEGQLGVVPLFTAIYSYLSPRRRPRFDGGELQFGIADQVVWIENVEVFSPVLTVTGGGKLRMDSYLDLTLDFPDFFGNAGDWLVLPRVIKYLGGRVVQFQIYGYLRRPKARPRWMWQPRASEAPITPIPALRPKPGNR
jgi:hypothetical protein